MSLTRKLTRPLTRPLVIASSEDVVESDNVVKSGSYKSFTPTFVGDKSIKFDGTDDVITTNVAVPDISSASMCYWVKRKSTGALLSGVSDGSRFYLGYSATTGQVWGGVGGTIQSNSGDEVPLDVWSHLALVADGGTMSVYLNGVLQASKAHTGSTPTSKIHIGAPVLSGGVSFTYADPAAIDEFAVFSSALTAREIDAIYNNGQPKNLSSYSTLKAWYRMGEGKLGTKSDGESNLLFDQGPNGGLGSNLVTNGTFDADSDWSHTGTTISGGTANFSVAGGSFVMLLQSLSYVDGSTYQLTATVNGTSGKVMRFMDSGANNGGLTTTNGAVTMTGSAQEVSITFKANSNSSTIVIARQSNTGDYSFTVDNVSVKEVQNVGTISGARIQADGGTELLTGFTNGSVSPFDTFTSNGRNITSAIETSANAGGAASNTISILSGQSYKVTFNLTYNSGSGAIRVAFVGSATGAANVKSNIVYTNTSGLNEAILTANSSASHLQLSVPSGHTVNFSATDISVKEVTESVPKQVQNLPSGASKKSMAFDGTDDFATIPYQLPTTTFTVSQWIKINEDSDSSTAVYIWDARDSTYNVANIFLPQKVSATEYKLRWWNAGDYRINNSTTYPIGLWQHVVLVKDGTTGTMYVDGEKLTSATTFSSPTNSPEITVGGRYAAPLNFAEADIDELAIWDTALDGDAVKALYNAGLPTHVATNTGAYDIYKDNLKAYYKMGDASDPAADGTSNLLFDQTNPGVGSELVKTDPFVSGSWSGYSANVVTFPSTTTVRVARPTSGGSSMGAAADLNTSILQSTPAAGTTLKISFDLNTDDSDLYAQIYNGSAYTNSTAGSGSKTVYLKMTGNGFIRFAGLDSDKFVELSNLTIREVNGHTGTITGATIQTEAPKQIYALSPVDNKFSLNFDGSNDYLDLGPSSDFFSTNINTISFWFKIGDTSSAEARIFVSNSDTGGSDMRVRVATSGQVSVDFWNGSGLSSTSGGPVADDSEWHHLVFTTTSSAQALYVDGALAATTTHTRSSRAGSVSATVAAHVTSAIYASMSADELGIWGVALTAENVRALYNRGRPTDISKSQGAYDQGANLLHWWRMGDAPVGQIGHSGNVLFQGLRFEGDEMFPTNAVASDWAQLSQMAWDGSTLSITDSSGTAISGYELVLPVGATFRLTFDVTNDGTGNIYARIGDGLNTIPLTNVTTGSYGAVHTVTSGGHNNRIAFITNGNFAGTITNISVTKIRGQYIGPELVKADADLYKASTWTSYGGNVETFPNGTAARFDRPSSGGDTRGGYVSLTSSEALTSNLETGCVYKLQFDFLTDDSDAFPRYYDGSSYTNLSAGSGLKVHYFGFSGSGFINVDALSADKFVQFSNLSVTKIGGAAVMTNMDPNTDLQLDTPY